jgi:hypothetical protein
MSEPRLASGSLWQIVASATLVALDAVVDPVSLRDMRLSYVRRPLPRLRAAQRTGKGSWDNWISERRSAGRRRVGHLRFWLRLFSVASTPVPGMRLGLR